MSTKAVAKGVKPKPPSIKDDPRVVELVSCLCFAMRSFKDQTMINETGELSTWHRWFKKTIRRSGVKVKFK